jgi:hypothetical protein
MSLDKKELADFSARLDALVKAIQGNAKYLQALGFENQLVGDLKNLADFVRRMNVEQAADLLGSQRPAKKVTSEKKIDISDEQIQAMSSEDLTALLSTADVSRSTLERVAAIRFSVTRGALSMLRSRDALRDKIATLMSHVRTHNAIRRVAGQESGRDAVGHLSDPDKRFDDVLNEVRDPIEDLHDEKDNLIAAAKFAEINGDDGSAKTLFKEAEAADAKIKTATVHIQPAVDIVSEAKKLHAGVSTAPTNANAGKKGYTKSGQRKV